MTYRAFRLAEKEGWDARSVEYDDFTGRVTTRAIPTLLVMAAIAPGVHVLDLCCGTGRAAGAASALGALAEGVDVSPAMVEVARAKFPNAVFDIGDAEAVPRESDTYDAVICSFGVMHIGNTEAMLAEAARVLKPGGRLALSNWVGPPESPFLKLVFGTMQQRADMTVVPPSPPPFALSSEAAMRAALERAGLKTVDAAQLPLVFKAPVGKFPEHFRKFAARAAMILDSQSDAVLNDIYSDWDAQLTQFRIGDEYSIPMPALAISAVFDAQ